MCKYFECNSIEFKFNQNFTINSLEDTFIINLLDNIENRLFYIS